MLSSFPATRRALTVPVHSSRDLKPGTLRSMIKQAGLSLEEFKALL
jgi:predicted RNA binding protein YcfA (HicA-like mRNA interferase family)